LNIKEKGRLLGLVKTAAHGSSQPVKDATTSTESTPVILPSSSLKMLDIASVSTDVESSLVHVPQKSKVVTDVTTVVTATGSWQKLHARGHIFRTISLLLKVSQNFTWRLMFDPTHLQFFVFPFFVKSSYFELSSQQIPQTCGHSLRTSVSRQRLVRRFSSLRIH